MAILVKAPELPFTGGIVTWWEKEIGQEVQFGEVLVEIRSGSTDYPVKAYLPGTLLHIFAKAGTEIQPDAPLALIGEITENIQEWLSLDQKSANPAIPETTRDSGFSTSTEPFNVQPAQSSSFSVVPATQPDGFMLAGNPLSDNNSGSSFTVAPAVQPTFVTTENLTSEQSQNRTTYGLGFEKFVKMRPVPEQGAMGELFFATQIISGRDVVIKRLKASRRSNTKSREYFMREINLGTLLPYHRHIINILYSDENEYGPYYVMERINGYSLQHLIDEGQLPVARIKEVFGGVLEGLRHVHAHLMVHRDLKPLNILVDTQHWIAKIIDFGFAKHPSYPDIDVFDMGTPGYMAPEQHGDPQAVDTRADIYALGCILYALVTREVPQSLDLLKVADPLFRTVIAQCTQTLPADRFQSVTEMIEALNQKTAPATPPVTAVQNSSLENFKTFINEWALEALPNNQPLSKLTIKLLQRQAEAVGINGQKLEAELNDFVELYREICNSGEITPFKKRSLLIQGELLHISEPTIAKLLTPDIPAITPVTKPEVPIQVQAAKPLAAETAAIETVPTSAVPMSPIADFNLPTAEQVSGYLFSPKILYARSVGLFEEFEDNKLTERPEPDSLFVIQVLDRNQATFTISDSPQAQDSALQNKRYYLHPACVLAEVEPVANQKITTLAPGKLERMGTAWKITQKAKIRIG